MNKVKMIRFTLKKEHIWFFRILMILVSIPFVISAYEAVVTNVAHSGKFTFVKGEHWGYYSSLLKDCALSFLFLWLGTFGSSIKSSS